MANASMANRVRALVVAALVLVVAGCSEPEVHHYVDPFPQGMEAAFAEAGLPILFSAVADNPTGYDADLGILLQIDAEACPAQDQQCLEDLLEAQPWNNYLAPSRHPSPTEVLQFGIRTYDLHRCSATGGPAEELRVPFGEPGPFEDVPELEPGMWYFFMYCGPR